MTEAERSYKEMKKRKYEEKKEDLESVEALAAIFTAVFALVAYNNIQLSAEDTAGFFHRLFHNWGGNISLILALGSFRGVIEAINEQAICISKIEDLEMALDIDELERKEGKEL